MVNISKIGGINNLQEIDKLELSNLDNLLKGSNGGIPLEELSGLSLKEVVSRIYQDVRKDLSEYIQKVDTGLSKVDVMSKLYDLASGLKSDIIKNLNNSMYLSEDYESLSTMICSFNISQEQDDELVGRLLDEFDNGADGTLKHISSDMQSIISQTKDLLGSVDNVGVLNNMQLQIENKIANLRDMIIDGSSENIKQNRAGPTLVATSPTASGTDNKTVLNENVLNLLKSLGNGNGAILALFSVYNAQRVAQDTNVILVAISEINTGTTERFNEYSQAFVPLQLLTLPYEYTAPDGQKVELTELSDIIQASYSDPNLANIMGDMISLLDPYLDPSLSTLNAAIVTDLNSALSSKTINVTDKSTLPSPTDITITFNNPAVKYENDQFVLSYKVGSVNETKKFNSFYDLNLALHNPATFGGTEFKGAAPFPGTGGTVTDASLNAIDTKIAKCYDDAYLKLIEDINNDAVSHGIDKIPKPTVNADGHVVLVPQEINKTTDALSKDLVDLGSINQSIMQLIQTFNQLSITALYNLSSTLQSTQRDVVSQIFR